MLSLICCFCMHHKLNLNETEIQWSVKFKCYEIFVLIFPYNDDSWLPFAIRYNCWWPIFSLLQQPCQHLVNNNCVRASAFTLPTLSYIIKLEKIHLPTFKIWVKVSLYSAWLEEFKSNIVCFLFYIPILVKAKKQQNFNFVGCHSHF